MIIAACAAAGTATFAQRLEGAAGLLTMPRSWFHPLCPDGQQGAGTPIFGA